MINDIDMTATYGQYPNDTDLNCEQMLVQAVLQSQRIVKPKTSSFVRFIFQSDLYLGLKYEKCQVVCHPVCVQAQRLSGYRYLLCH
jgi:hypothetical protein